MTKLKAADTVEAAKGTTIRHVRTKTEVVAQSAVERGQIVDDGRFIVRHRGLDEHHVRDIATAIRNGRSIAPVLLWADPDRAGGKLVLLDGRHRLAAYRLVNWRQPIPVTLINGAYRDALMAACLSNSAAALPMTAAERADFAWRMTRESEATFTLPEVARTSGLSQRTAGTMRRRWAEILKADSVAQVTGSWHRDKMTAMNMAEDKNFVDVAISDLEKYRSEIEQATTAVKAAIQKLYRVSDEATAEVLYRACGPYKLKGYHSLNFGDADEFDDDPNGRENDDITEADF